MDSQLAVDDCFAHFYIGLTAGTREADVTHLQVFWSAGS